MSLLAHHGLWMHAEASTPPDPAAGTVFAKLVSWWDFDVDLRDLMGANHLIGTGTIAAGHIGNRLAKTSRAEKQSALGLPDWSIAPGVSIGGWIYISGTGQEDYQLLSGTGERLRLAVRNGNQIHLIAGNTSTTTISSSVGAVSVGNWYFWCGTVDRATNAMKLYLGSTEIASGTAGTGYMSTTNRISFGRVSGNTHAVLHNDASFVCSDVLTPDEIAWLYNGGAGRSGSEFAPYLEYPAARSIGEGVWTWFNDPRAIRAGSNDIVGVVGSDGARRVYHSTDDFATFGAFALSAAGTDDDHDNPALLRRSADDHLVAAYVRHNASIYNKRISTNPDDASAWAAEANIIGDLGASTASYANLIELSAEAKIFNFYRDYPGAYVSESADDGASFGAGVNMLASGGERPYIKAVRNGSARIDFLVTDGHPAEASTSVYHYYYQGAAYYDSAGAAAGSLPLAFSSVTRLWDGTAGSGRGWVWDIVPDGSDITAVYAVFPTTSDHRYRYARCTGGVWTQSEICAAGGALYGAQPYYSGGVCIDPDDPDYVYACRQVSGEWGLYRHHTSDGGATWDSGTLVFKRTGWHVFRPYIAPGSNKVLFCAGSYVSFTNYSANIWMIPITR